MEDLIIKAVVAAGVLSLVVLLALAVVMPLACAVRSLGRTVAARRAAGQVAETARRADLIARFAKLHAKEAADRADWQRIQAMQVRP